MPQTLGLGLAPARLASAESCGPGDYSQEPCGASVAGGQVGVVGRNGGSSRWESRKMAAAAGGGVVGAQGPHWCQGWQGQHAVTGVWGPRWQGLWSWAGAVPAEKEENWLSSLEFLPARAPCFYCLPSPYLPSLPPLFSGQLLMH